MRILRQHRESEYLVQGDTAEKWRSGIWALEVCLQDPCSYQLYCLFIVIEIYSFSIKFTKSIKMDFFNCLWTFWTITEKSFYASHVSRNVLGEVHEAKCWVWMFLQIQVPKNRKAEKTNNGVFKQWMRFSFSHKGILKLDKSIQLSKHSTFPTHKQMPEGAHLSQLRAQEWFSKYGIKFLKCPHSKDGNLPLF